MEKNISLVIELLKKYESERNRSATNVYSLGNCGALFLMLDRLFPNSFKAYTNESHILAKHSDAFYDIGGKVSSQELCALARTNELMPAYNIEIERKSFNYTYLKYFSGKTYEDVQDKLPDIIAQNPKLNAELAQKNLQAAALELEATYMTENLSRLSKDLNIPLVNAEPFSVPAFVPTKTTAVNMLYD